MRGQQRAATSNATGWLASSLCLCSRWPGGRELPLSTALGPLLLLRAVLLLLGGEGRQWAAPRVAQWTGGSGGTVTASRSRPATVHE